MPVLKKFCCCCSLRTGGVVYGWLGFICAAFNITGTSVLLAYTQEWSNANVYNHDLHTALSLSLPYMLTGGIIMLLSYIMLFVGSSTGKAFLVLPALIVDMMGIVGETILVLFAGPIFISNYDLTVYGIIILAVGLPMIGLSLYWWLCVLSLFQELRRAQSTKNESNNVSNPDDTLISETSPSFKAVTFDYTPPPYSKLIENA